MANKKQKTAIVIVIGIVILAILASQGKLPFSIGSGLVTGVSLLNSISNDADLDSSFFRVAYTPDVGSENIVAQFDDTKFDKLTPGFNTDYDLTIGAKVSKQTVNYKINPGSGSRDAVYLYSILTLTSSIFKSPSACPNSGNVETIAEHKELAFTKQIRYCVTKTGIGRFGDFDNPTSTADIDINIKRSDGRTYTKTVSNAGENPKNQDFYENGKLIARGYLVHASNSAGASPKSTVQYRAMYSTLINTWVVVTRSDYDTYNNKKDYIESKASEMRSRPSSNSLKLVETAIDDIEFSYIPFQKFGTVKNFGEKNSYLEFLYSSSQIQLIDVNLVIDVQARWLGVKSSVSKPDIRNLECKDFTSSGSITFDIYNTGETSKFTPRLINCGTIQQSQQLRDIEVSKYGSERVNIPINIAANEGSTQTCTIRVYNSQKSSLYDEDFVSCTSKKLGICSPGEQEKRIVSKKECIYICGSNGYWESRAKECKDVFVSGMTTTTTTQTNLPCEPYISLFDKTIIPNIGCIIKDIFSGVTNLLTAIKYIFIIIASLFTIFTTFDITERFKGIKRNRKLRWVISIIVAGLLAYFLYLFIGSFTFYVILAGWGIYTFFAPRILAPLNILRGFR